MEKTNDPLSIVVAYRPEANAWFVQWADVDGNTYVRLFWSKADAEQFVDGLKN